MLPLKHRDSAHQPSAWLQVRLVSWPLPSATHTTPAGKAICMAWNQGQPNSMLKAMILAKSLEGSSLGI